jgi:hypothetical protein
LSEKRFKLIFGNKFVMGADVRSRKKNCIYVYIKIYYSQNTTINYLMGPLNFNLYLYQPHITFLSPFSPNRSSTRFVSEFPYFCSYLSRNTSVGGVLKMLTVLLYPTLYTDTNSARCLTVPSLPGHPNALSHRSIYLVSFPYYA